MDWFQLLKSRNRRGIVRTILFNDFSREKCIQFRKNVDDCRNQLYDMGNNLTDSDYELVKSLSDKMELNACAYRSMIRLGDITEKKDPNKIFMEIDRGIKNYEDF